MHRLKNTLVELAGALGHPLDDARAAAIDAKLADDELAADEAAPEWLIAFLQCIARRVHTPTWVPFEVKGLEASNSFDFIRGLDQILPVRVVNDEERWTLVAEAIGHEGILAFEGYLYLTKPIGAPEPGDTDLV